MLLEVPVAQRIVFEHPSPTFALPGLRVRSRRCRLLQQLALLLRARHERPEHDDAGTIYAATRPPGRSVGIGVARPRTALQPQRWMPRPMAAVAALGVLQDVP
jgi:hypothetical protein